jgi:hypothetical protein
MATSSLPPMLPAAAGRIRQFVATVSHYVVNHEKFLLFVLVAALAWGVSGKVEKAILAHDQHNLTVAQAQLAATQAANANRAKEAQQATEAATQAKQAAAAANLALARATDALRQALAKQQAADAQLTPPALAQRIETLAGATPGSVTPIVGGYSVTQPGAVQIAQTLEIVPELKAECSNAKSEAANNKSALDASAKEAGTLHEQVGGLQLQLTQADKVCKDEIKVVKDQARASKRKWFVAGFVAGLVTRGAMKLFAGF